MSEEIKKPGTFKKNDVRINRKGRPKSFDKARELAQQIAHEVAKTGDDKPLVLEGHLVTIAEYVLRSWALSKNPTLQIAFFEYAFGKVPTKTEIDMGAQVVKGYAIVSPDDWDEIPEPNILTQQGVLNDQDL